MKLASALLCLLLPGLPDDKPGAVVKKAVAETQKKKSAAIAEKSGLQTTGRPLSYDFQGVMKKDFAGVVGAMEVYSKGPAALAKLDNQFVEPRSLKGEPGLKAMSFRNPSLFFNEILRLAPDGWFGKDADVGGVGCREIGLSADAALLKMHLKEAGDRIGTALAEATRGIVSGNASSYMDEKNSSSAYKVWVGKEDNLIYKIEWVVKPKIKANAIPKELGAANLANLQLTIEVTFSKWDEEVDFAIPPGIAAKWGVK